MLNPSAESQRQNTQLVPQETTISFRAGERCVGRRIQSNILWAGTGRLLSVALLLALHAGLARFLSAADYGRYILLESVTLVLSLVIMAGLPSVSLRLLRTQLLSGNGAGAADIVRVSLGIMVGTSVLTTLAVSAFAFLAGDRALSGNLWTWLPWILGWTTFIAWLRMVSELARGYEMLGFSYLVGGQSGGFGVNGILLFAVVATGVLNGLSLRGMLTVQIVVQCLCAVAALIMIFRVASQNSLPAFAAVAGQPRVRPILQSSFPLLIQHLVAFGLPEADTMMLGAYSTGEDVALYGSAKKLVFLAGLPLLLVSHAIKPFITEFHARSDADRLTTLVRGTTTFAAIPSILVVLALLIAPDFILQICFGDAFGSAATSLRVLCVGAIAFILTGTCSLVLTMTGHERTGMWLSLTVGVVYLLVTPLLISGFGINGAAIAAAGLQCSANLGSMLLVYHHERVWTGITFSGNMVVACFRIIFPRKAGKES